MSGCDITVVVQTPPPLTLVVQPAAAPADGPGMLPPLVCASSRALTAADSGRVLQLVHGITLTVPAGLPPAFACQLLMPAMQVMAGGVVTLQGATGVVVNGLQGRLQVRRVANNAAPWMAWLQSESSSGSYACVAIGATVQAEFESAWLTLHSIGVN